MKPINLLVIGSGGREHAIVWKLSQSVKVDKIFVSPGNAGCNLVSKVQLMPDLNIKDHQIVADFCYEKKVDLVVIGPEDPLANGLVDDLMKKSIKCFGPVKCAARIEASKSFSKDLMSRHNIPTAKFKTFTCPKTATIHIMNAPYKALVVKASGLAAGKGVVVAQSKEEACQVAHQMLQDKTFGSAGEEIVIEELLEGEEVSALCFTDGRSVRLMPIAQDHKRLLENDQGPNTGGMGAYAPCDWLPIQTLKYIEQIVQRTVDCLRKEGIIYRGVLYAGIMLTSDGPKVLEYNCRFGDPETQSILPLLQSDLCDVLFACADENLEILPIEWETNTTACGIVLVSGGYPGNYEKSIPIRGLDGICPDDVLVFHAGTKKDESGAFVTNGGRVLNLIGLGKNLLEAKSKATSMAELVTFDKCFYRNDIGFRSLMRNQLTYDTAGVSISAGNQLVESIKPVCAATTRPGCIDSIGSFGAFFDLAAAGYTDPILVMGNDGVGTKLKIAEECNCYDTIGVDLVAMCVNDVLCNGAEPLAFLDYYVTGQLDVDKASTVINGIAKGCKQANCALIGGETAEMPGVYDPNQWDLAGFVLGALNRDQPKLPKISEIKSDDIVVGLPSSGLHSNGFSLVRKLIEKLGINYGSPCTWNSSLTIGQELLKPTKIYVSELLPSIRAGLVKAIAHITGGGLIENIPRVLPDDLTVKLDANTWDMPEVFSWISCNGPVSSNEMCRTFNCGIGMVLIVDSKFSAQLLSQLADVGARQIGSVVRKTEIITQVQVDNLEQVLSRNMHNSISTCIPFAKKRVAVLFSGTGTNLQALIDYSLRAESKCEIVLVITNMSNAKGLERANKHGITAKIVSHKGYKSREAYDAVLDECLAVANVDVICLAGFMRILSEWFTVRWEGKLINTHPSILPSFKGAHAPRDALAAGARISGCTVHFVVAEVDAGAIIEQAAVKVEDDDTETTLSERIKIQEHQIYPEAMENVATGRVRLENGRAVRS